MFGDKITTTLKNTALVENPVPVVLMNGLVIYRSWLMEN